MKEVNSSDLKSLSLGAALLGSGGGGDPAILYNQAHYLLEKNGPVKIIQAENLNRKALVVPLALMGAPLISLERIPNSQMFMELLKKIKLDYPFHELVLMPAEIGGCNALTPFILAAQTGLPILDADLIGRAFPKLEMCKPAILGKIPQRSYLSSPFGDCLTLNTASLKDLEREARTATVRFGGSALIATFLFEAFEQESYLIPGSLSRAIKLGTLLNRQEKDLSLLAKLGAKSLGRGLIREVCHVLEEGFLTGYAEIKTATTLLRIVYQNEYLLVYEQNKQPASPLASSPELILLLEAHSLMPLTSEALRYGLKVEVFSLPSPPFWEKEEAHQQVNLQAFGLINERGFLNV